MAQAVWENQDLFSKLGPIFLTYDCLSILTPFLVMVWQVLNLNLSWESKIVFYRPSFRAFLVFLHTLEQEVPP